MTIDELNRRTELAWKKAQDKELTWEVKLSEATGLYITRCPELGLISQGRTEQEALDSIQDSTRLYLKHCGLRGITPKRKNQS